MVLLVCLQIRPCCANKSRHKPTVTVTSDVTGKVNEGSTVTHTISFDKPIERSVTFTQQ
jgi:hypothetical protein